MISARSRSIRLAAGAAVVTLALAGCGGDGDDGATPTSSTTPTATTPSETPTDEATEPSTDPSASPSESPSDDPAPEQIVARARVTAGEVFTESDTVAVAPGDNVRIAVKSDVANELHVHGVEQSLALEPNVKGVLEFQIPPDLAPGVYEVELHDGPILLFSLEVS